jgi:hypothetical protein
MHSALPTARPAVLLAAGGGQPLMLTFGATVAQKPLAPVTWNGRWMMRLASCTQCLGPEAS